MTLRARCREVVLRGDASVAAVTMSVDNCSTDVPPTLVANPSSSVDCGQHSWRPWDASKPRRVFDMFIVNGEIDLLEARLASLFSIVDVFVAVEASKTSFIVEASDGLKVGKWEVKYPGVDAQFALAGIDPQGPNHWSKVGCE